MAYTFEQVFAADPSNPANVARNAAVTIFAPGDVAKTPLTLTTPNGDPLPNPLQVNNNGFGSAFMHATLDRVAWSGGNFTGFFTSYEGMKEEAVAARDAAQTIQAQASAGAFKGDTGSQGPQGPIGPVSTTPGPKGDKGDRGDQGLPGTNAVATDTAVAGYIDAASSETKTAIAKRNIPNIEDYGVVSGSASDQTPAIQAALDSKPGSPFWFPGSYRMDTPLVITKQNSLVIDGELKAYSVMNDMITFDPDIPTYLYAQNKFIVGRGTINANLKANRALVVNQVLGFNLGRGLTILDAINRFLYTGPIGAQMVVENLNLLNTTDTNVADNVGIEANMGDCVFRDVFARDITVFMKDYKANLWDACHPWIGPNWSGGQQMTLRYPGSIGFDLTGPSTLRGCIADTFQTQYMIRSNGTGYTERPNFLDCRATWAETVVPPAIAAANPSAVFDNTAGVGFVNDRARVSGLTFAPAEFIRGPITNIDSRNNKNQGYVVGKQGTTTDSLDYRGGVQEGSFVFTPTIIGSNSAGTHTYASRTGRMVVNRDTVTYYVRIVATLDSTTGFAGSLQIGGLPLPSGATSLRDSSGSLAYSVNVNASSAAIFASATPRVAIMSLSATGTAAVDIPGQALRGKSVDLMLSVPGTYIKA